MTTIASSLYSGQYYSLANPNTTVASAATTTQASAQTVSATANDSLSAYLLDLSPDAQNYLNSLGSTDSLTSPSSTSSSTGSSDGSSSFTLTSKQQQEISDILAKYKDAPQTQDTFNQIQDDLKQAGLSPDQLSMEDKVNSFNSTQILMSALNGSYTDPTTYAATTNASEQTKSNNFIQQIIKQWQSLAPAVPATSASADA